MIFNKYEKYEKYESEMYDFICWFCLLGCWDFVVCCYLWRGVVCEIWGFIIVYGLF